MFAFPTLGRHMPGFVTTKASLRLPSGRGFHELSLSHLIAAGDEQRLLLPLPLLRGELARKSPPGQRVRSLGSRPYHHEQLNNKYINYVINYFLNAVVFVALTVSV